MPLIIIEFIFLVGCYLIHSYRQHIFFCFILSRINPVGMCESHSRPPGLCLFTTSLSRVVYKVMNHHHDSLLVTFSGRKIKQCGQMAGISGQYQYFQGYLDNVFRLVVAFQIFLCGQCHFSVFKYLNSFFSDVSTDWQAFVCRNREIEMRVPFHAVKRKQSWINNIVVFFSSIFWQTEWGWKVFSAHWLYYDMSVSYFIPHVFCYVCMFVVFAGPSKPYSEQSKN